jgi:anti-anti-sigma factor
MSTAPSPSSSEFSVDVLVGRHETVAFVTGEIDIATCEHLRDAIEPHLGPDQRVVLDLAGVHFMDSTCLNVFLKARTRLSADGGSLILRNPSRAARTLLSAAGLEALFDIEIG